MSESTLGIEPDRACRLTATNDFVRFWFDQQLTVPEIDLITIPQHCLRF